MRGTRIGPSTERSGSRSAAGGAIGQWLYFDSDMKGPAFRDIPTASGSYRRKMRRDLPVGGGNRRPSYA
jgi:hypothetical protein